MYILFSSSVKKDPVFFFVSGNLIIFFALPSESPSAMRQEKIGRGSWLDTLPLALKKHFRLQSIARVNRIEEKPHVVVLIMAQPCKPCSVHGLARRTTRALLGKIKKRGELWACVALWRCEGKKRGSEVNTCSSCILCSAHPS